MAQNKFGSAGVKFNEIDLSAPLKVEPTGIPACVIGTTVKGPAFVPITLGSSGDFDLIFGASDGIKFGPLATYEWLRNARSLTFVKVLGVGTGEQRTSDGADAGKVMSAGFIVGEKQPNEVGALAANPYANVGGVQGRTFFLGAFMSESNDSTFFSDAGAQLTPAATPILRGVIMAALGVLIRMSSSIDLSVSGRGSSAPTSVLIANDTNALGVMNGDVIMQSNGESTEEFVLLLNGHKGLDVNYPNIITASFDVRNDNYFANVLNTDPFKLQEAGHYLYAHYDIHPALAVVTGSGIVSMSRGAGAPGTGHKEPSAFVVTGTNTYDVGTSTVPNYENWEDRFSAPKTPWIISQKFGGRAENLFRIHALDDGTYSSAKLKFSIENITPSSDPDDKHGSFDLVVRSLTDKDLHQVILEAFRGVNLNPQSTRYVGSVIGDYHVFFDFDQTVGAQKMVVEGSNPNQSTLIRVEMASDVENQTIDATALPMGFRGIHHLVTSGSAPLTTSGSTGLIVANVIKNTKEPPLQLRETITAGADPKMTVQPAYYWGTQFEHISSLSTKNSSALFNDTILGFGKYFPDFQLSYMNFSVGDNEGIADTAANGIVDADRFNKNMFTLENIQIVTGTTGLADSTQWVNAVYVRNGVITANETNKTRALTINDITTPNRKFAKFSFFMQGGFDGVNIFNSDESALTNQAIMEEMDNSTRGLNSGPIASAYAKALEVVANKTDVDVQILTIPGIRAPVITDAALQTVEDRFDAMYIMDIQSYDMNGLVVSGSGQETNITTTATNFVDRSINSSFGAAYFPDVVMTDPTTKTNVIVPPSVVVLGAFALNDRIAYPWFAAAGFTRGSLPTSIETQLKLSDGNMDMLYDSSINPLVAFPGTIPQIPGQSGQIGGVVVWGQKTLQQAASALDRVNVRRLLIDIRRKVRDVGYTFIFEPNRDANLVRFQSAVNPILADVKKKNGVEEYLVTIDTSTTTQADIENNTIRGKIFVRPTKSVEFVSIDFQVTNQTATL